MPRGTCTTMCPHQEIVEREQKRRLHQLEIMQGCDKKSPQADYSKCVKEYVRSAAGSLKTDPRLLRTPEALRKTTRYLLGSVLDLATNSQSWVSTTNFISDRLRCVRQDIIVQQLPWQHAVPILERIIRYHIAVECLLMKESLSDYDPILNNVLLDSYMGDLFEYYDAAERENKTLKYSTEFVGYYILLNIQNASIFYKENISNYYHKNCNSRAELATTKLLVENFYKRNFYRFFKTVKELTFLQACCLIKSYNILRINFLKQLNVAFSNKSLKFPLEKIQEWMLFSSTEDARIFLNTCGFSVPVDVSFLYFDKNILVKDFSPVELIELNYTLSSQKFFQEKQLETKLLLHTINKNDEDYLS